MAERKLPHQIVFKGYINYDILMRLEEKRREKGIRLDVRCPVCNSGIKIKNDSVSCLVCDDRVEIFQDRFFTKAGDTRILYVSIGGHEKEIHRLDMWCFSCDVPLLLSQTCNTNCQVETYLILEFVNGEIYLTYFLNKLDGFREKGEIPIRRTYRYAPESPIEDDSIPTQTPSTSLSQENADLSEEQTHPPTANPRISRRNASETSLRPDLSPQVSKHASKHKNLKGHVRAYFEKKGVWLAKFEELLEAINSDIYCSRTGLNNALNKLINDGYLRRISEGYYERVRQRSKPRNKRNPTFLL